MGLDVKTGASPSEIPMELDMATAGPVLDTLIVSTGTPEKPNELTISAKPIDPNIVLVQDPTIHANPNPKVRNIQLIAMSFS